MSMDCPKGMEFWRKWLPEGYGCPKVRNQDPGLDGLNLSHAQFRFCTNTTQSSGDTLANQLKKLGFHVSREEIFTSLSACRQLVKSRGLRPLLLLEQDALQDFDEIQQSGPHNAVVVGLSPSSFHYDKLNKAFRLLIESKSTAQPAILIAVHKAKYFADKDGLSMGPGGFVEALEYASGVKAHVVGKPQKTFFELAVQNMGIDLSAEQNQTHSKGSSGIVMIGDDVEQDLGGGAAELGLIRYLVMTGKYRAKDEDRDAYGGLDGTFADFGA
ncbi:Haloacid dehalogenase-like hydrolase domain-containing protein 2, partial [Modicella reniformis]